MAATADDFSIRPAVSGDRTAVAALLSEAKLPLEGLSATLDSFLVAEQGGVVCGAVGLELYGADALLRSAVVAATQRGSGLGRRLVDTLLDDVRRRGLRGVYLLTTTADDWFPRFGFERITRADVPAAVRASAEFAGACPDSAVVMALRLES